MKDLERVAEYTYKDQAVRVGVRNDEIIVERRVKRVGGPIWVQMRNRRMSDYDHPDLR